MTGNADEGRPITNIGTVGTSLRRLTLLTLLSCLSMVLAGGAGGPVQVKWPAFPADPACIPAVPNGTLRLGSWPDAKTTARLNVIFQADQADRRGVVDWSRVVSRDQARQAEVLKLLQSGKVSTGEELVDAAFVFQHGDCPNHYLLANVLADQAIKRGSPDSGAKWIYAATYDRWLTSQNRPQKFGTQYQGDAEGCHFFLLPYDPDTTDAERAAYDVPALAQAKANAETFRQPDCP